MTSPHDEGLAQRLRALEATCGFTPPWRDEPDLTVGQYARSLFRPQPLPTSEDAHLSRALLWDELARAAARARFTDEERARLRRELEAFPVIQTADHLQLLLDRTTYCNNLLFAIGAAENGLRHIVCNASTSNTLRAGRDGGPGLLRIGATTLNVFGLPGRRLSSMCVAAKGCPVSFELRPIGVVSESDAPAVAFLRGRLGREAYDAPCEAFLEANRDLFRALSSDPKGVVPLLTDDWLVSDLVAAHLETPESPIHRLFSAPGALDHLLVLRCTELSPIERRALPASTAFFWGVDRTGRRLSMQSSNGMITDADGRVCLPISPAALAAALRERRILPDLFLGFLVLGILPRVRVVGGFSQAIYLGVIDRLYGQVATRHLGVDAADLPPLDADSSGLVHGLIAEAFRGGVPLEDLSAVAAAIGSMPLRAAAGGLEAADYLTRWTP